MSPFFRLLSSVKRYPRFIAFGVLFHVLTAILTVISIPLIIPFFQILFGVSPSDYPAPDSIWDLEKNLNYGFSRLIAMTDHFIALKIVCIAVVVVFFLKNLSRFLTSYFMVFVRNAILRDLRGQIWSSYETQSLTDRHHTQQGYLMSLITNDLSEVDHGILKVFELLFKTPLIILGSLIFMIWLSPRLTIIAFVLILFTFIIIGGVSHVLKRQSAAAQSILSIMTVLVDQYLSGTKLIRVHHASGYFRKVFSNQNEAYFKISNKMLRRRDLASPLAEFFGVITIVILLYFGAHEVFDDHMQPTTFFAFIFAFYNIIDPAKSFSREYSNIQKGMAALDRIEGFVGVDYRETEKQIEKLGARFERSISFENVDYSYNNDNDVLHGLSWQISKGERIGIVGKSGVGKTTIVDLLLKFYNPQQGKISIDDIDILDFDSESYRLLFGLVTQNPVLFYGSVEENIILDQEKDETMLLSILSSVGLSHDFLHHRIGDQTSMISGGEAQRVSIARLLYRSPDIYILDEPSSNLDASSQRAIKDTIMSVTIDKTVIMITHQVDLLKNMDKILVLDQGAVVDVGAYEELYQRSDIFRSLCN